MLMRMVHQSFSSWFMHIFFVDFLWFLSCTKRTIMVFWSNHFLINDSYRVFRVYFTLGTNEFMGCYCNYESASTIPLLVKQSFMVMGRIQCSQSTSKKFFSYIIYFLFNFSIVAIHLLSYIHRI